MASFRQRAKNKRQDLINNHRATQQQASKSQYGSVLIPKKFPDGVEQFYMKDGWNSIDIIPFFAGKEDERVEEGSLRDWIFLKVHRNIGAANDHFVCPTLNFGLPCPICEYMNKNRIETEEWKKIKATDIYAYLVWAHNDKEEEKKGIQILLMAGYIFQDQLEELRFPDNGGEILYTCIDEGRTIKVKRTGKGMGTRYLGYQFVDRIEPLPDRILNASFSLDEVIDMHPDYNRIYRAFYGSEATNDDTGQEASYQEEDQNDINEDEGQSEDPIECPYDHVFGEDYGNHEDCDDCVLNLDCKAEAPEKKEQPKTSGRRRFRR